MELNKNKSPLISVIITVFNRAQKLKRAVMSVLSQTFKDFEIIIVDDGSTDNPEKFIFGMIIKGYNIKYLKHSNRGTPLSLNAGIRLASGKYVTFLDSDDEYLPEHLEKRFTLFNDNKKLDLIHTTAKIVGSAEDMLIPDARNPSKLIHIEKCVFGATIFGKKKVFELIKGFRDIYGYDYDFINRCKRKFYIEKIDLPTYIYNRNTEDSFLTKKKNMIITSHR
jgi:glycosyltransferase involved in cell wall biosynthesis